MHLRVRDVSIFVVGLFFLAFVVESQMIEERQVQCNSNEMRVYFKFNQPFTGVVYADKYYRSPSCRFEGDGARALVAAVPLNTDPARQPFCGVQMKTETGECTVTLLISPIRGLLVNGMEGLTVRCLYHVGDVTLTLPGGSLGGAGLMMSSHQAQSNTVTGSGGSPFLEMRIKNSHSVNGDIVQSAEVGQPITLDVNMRDTAVYDFRVHDCYAHDGSNTPEATIGIMDTHGCAMPLSRAVGNEVFVTRADPASGAKHIYINLWGFQFATSQLVYFECQVKPCLQICEESQCPPPQIQAPPAGRLTKREISKNNLLREGNASVERLGKPDNYNLTAVIRIEPQSLEALIPVARDSVESAPEQMNQPSEVCIKMDVAVGILVIFLLVCIVSLFISIYMCYRARAQDKGSTMSSYFSPPLSTASSRAGLASSSGETTPSPPHGYSRRLGSHIRYSLSQIGSR